MRRAVLALLLAGCTPTVLPADPPPRYWTPPPSSDDDDDAGDETHPVYDAWTVQEIVLTTTPEAVEALRETPRSWVEADLHFNDVVVARVGLRLKGSASFQDVDRKPAMKIKMAEYVPEQRLHDLERLTLNNEVHDPSMMSENLGFRAFRENGAPAPRTGYAAVTLNDRYLGLYALIESMDDDFMEANWPDAEGGLWEMTRNCDFDGDCTCFELQETGVQYDPQGIFTGCEAVARSGVGALDEAFDRDAVLGFLAVERALNHPDSYSYNLNNFFVHHDPLEQKLTLTPWGADSMFTYWTPASRSNPSCEPLYRDVLVTNPRGLLGRLCYGDVACSDELAARVVEVADWIDDVDLIGAMEATRDMLDPYVPLETHVNWTADDRRRRIDCFGEWTAARPDELRSRFGR